MRHYRGLVVAVAVGMAALQSRVTPAPSRVFTAPVSQSGPDSPAVQVGEAPTPPTQTVQFDVFATNPRGQIVDNLKRTDFEVREDGALQEVEEVAFVKADRARDASIAEPRVDSATDEKTEAGRTGIRLFAIFLDEYHVSAAHTQRVRDAVSRFVDENLEPRDLIVVLRPLESLLTIRLTRDRDRVGQVIGQFEGRQGDYTPRTDYERNFLGGTQARIEQFRDQVATSALHALATHLGSLSRTARKTLIVVSEGLPQASRRRGFESLPTADSVIRAANRSNVTVYAVDPRPAPIQTSAASEGDVLRALVSATDGRSIAEAGDLAAGMRLIGTDSSGYYLLSFRSSQKANGLFREVRVSVKRAGVSVRARKGYWTARAEDQLAAALLMPLPAPPALGPPLRMSPLIQPWVGSARGADGKTRVTIVWEPATRVPGDRIRQSAASRVSLKALAADGTALFDGVLRPTGGPAERTEEATRAVFDAPPGRLRLQMAIEDQAAQSVDSDVREVSVRDLAAPVALGTPEVLRARTARDFRALENDFEAAPVVARVFSRSERLIIRVPAYAPQGVALTVSAKLLGRSGQVMRELEIRKVPAPSTLTQIDVPLAGLAADEYLIDFIAQSPAGEAKDRLQFRVTY